MFIDPLPYTVHYAHFEFPALIARAAALPLGGGREIALATLMAARLANGSTREFNLTAEERSARANGARVWLSSIALPSTLRNPIAKCIESTTGSPQSVASAVRALLNAVSQHLDQPSVLELEKLVRRLSDSPLS